MSELISGLIELAKIIREDPRIGWALAILLSVGAVVAFLIGKVRRDDPLSIRDKRP